MASRPTTIDDALQPILTSLLKLLRKPAGDDPRYMDLDWVRQHPAEMFAAVHAGWKEFQTLCLSGIFAQEDLLAQVAKRDPRRARLEYHGMLLRKAYDAMAWYILGKQRHVVKRLCGYRKRNRLSECNPESILSFLCDLNADPQKVAIWNDATSFIDVGDVMVFEPMTNKWCLYEVKSGAGASVVSALESSETEEEAQAFIAQYGDKGRKQVERSRRQMERGQQVMNLINDEKGFDPFAQQEMSILELKTTDDTYEDELDRLIERSGSVDEAWDVVDDSLWIYVARTPGREALAAFLSLLREKIPDHLDWLHGATGLSPEKQVHSLTSGLHYPAVRPLFMLQVSDEALLQIAFQRLHVLLFLDWKALVTLAGERGGTLAFSSKKEGRKAKAKPVFRRPLVLGDAIPQITSHGTTSSIGAPHLLRVFYEAIRPGTMVSQFIESNQILRDV